jgi:hypothetical protein
MQNIKDSYILPLHLTLYTVNDLVYRQGGQLTLKPEYHPIQ